MELVGYEVGKEWRLRESQPMQRGRGALAAENEAKNAISHNYGCGAMKRTSCKNGVNGHFEKEEWHPKEAVSEGKDGFLVLTKQNHTQ